jgi:hypothetical protein
VTRLSSFRVPLLLLRTLASRKSRFASLPDGSFSPKRQASASLSTSGTASSKALNEPEGSLAMAGHTNAPSTPERPINSVVK